jgi:hypothetical protein
MILEEKIKILIQKLEKEKNRNYLFISSSQMTKLLFLLSSMLNNLLNKENISNISNEINLIVHWSIDEWEWNILTKEILEIVEKYEKKVTVSRSV